MYRRQADDDDDDDDDGAEGTREAWRVRDTYIGMEPNGVVTRGDELVQLCWSFRAFQRAVLH